MAQITEFIGNHMGLFLAWVGLGIAMVVSEFGNRFRSFQEVSAQEAVQLMNKEDAMLVDIRAHGEFTDGHITGAKHLLLSKVEAIAPMFKSHKEKPVIFYCKSGMTSQQAASRLGKAEFTRIYSLKGGISGWISDQLPIEKGQ